MKKRIFKTVLLILISVLIYNCSAQKKTNQIDANREVKVKLLQSKLNLTNSQITKIIDNDSIMDQIVLSLKDSLSSNLIRKHIDPFFTGKYNTKITWILLRLQTRYKNDSFELASKKEAVNFPKFETIKELESHLDKLDSLLSKPIKMVRIDSIKKDSTKKKKQ